MIRLSTQKGKPEEDDDDDDDEDKESDDGEMMMVSFPAPFKVVYYCSIPGANSESFSRTSEC